MKKGKKILILTAISAVFFVFALHTAFSLLVLLAWIVGALYILLDGQDYRPKI